MVDALNYTKHLYVVVLGFHGPSTHFRSYRERSITLAYTVPGQQYKGKRLSLRLETVCHNACILKNIQIGISLNFVCVCIFIKHNLLSL